MNRGVWVDTHILLWMLIAQARTEVLALLTRDAKIADYAYLLPA